MRRLLVAAVLLGACSFPPVPSNRNTPRTLQATPGPAPGIVPLAPEGVAELDGVIVANNVSSVVVRGGAQLVTVRFGPSTRITLDGVTVGLRALQPGYPVHVSYETGEILVGIDVAARSQEGWANPYQPLDTRRQQTLL